MKRLLHILLMIFLLFLSVAQCFEVDEKIHDLELRNKAQQTLTRIVQEMTEMAKIIDQIVRVSGVLIPNGMAVLALKLCLALPVLLFL